MIKYDATSSPRSDQKPVTSIQWRFSVDGLVTEFFLGAVARESLGLTFFSAATFRLQPLAEIAQHTRHHIDGDDHQNNEQQAPRHRQMVAGEC